jgi:hypothetical protein
MLRLPRSTFCLVLRKEYFDCPQRESHAVHNRGGRGESVLLYSVVLHRPICEDSDKIPEGRTSIYILWFKGV